MKKKLDIKIAENTDDISSSVCNDKESDRCGQNLALLHTHALLYHSINYAVLSQCSVVGDSHYRTFDDHVFDFKGNCDDSLVTICDPMDAQFSVVKINQTSEGAPRKAIMLSFEDLGSVSV